MRYQNVLIDKGNKSIQLCYENYFSVVSFLSHGILKRILFQVIVRVMYIHMFVYKVLLNNGLTCTHLLLRNSLFLTICSLCSLELSLASLSLPSNPCTKHNITESLMHILRCLFSLIIQCSHIHMKLINVFLHIILSAANWHCR